MPGETRALWFRSASRRKPAARPPATHQRHCAREPGRPRESVGDRPRRKPRAIARAEVRWPGRPARPLAKRKSLDRPGGDSASRCESERRLCARQRARRSAARSRPVRLRSKRADRENAPRRGASGPGAGAFATKPAGCGRRRKSPRSSAPPRPSARRTGRRAGPARATRGRARPALGRASWLAARRLPSRAAWKRGQCACPTVILPRTTRQSRNRWPVAAQSALQVGISAGIAGRGRRRATAIRPAAIVRYTPRS